jgi:hypothetical protein
MERRTYSSQELEQVNKAEQMLHAKGLDEGSERIADLLDGYFQTNRAVPVTVEAIVKLVEAQPGLKWLSPAELEYRRIAAVNPAAAEQLADWLAKQGGRPGALIHTGDQGFQNSANILAELRGREINAKTILEAIGRIGAPSSRFDTRKRPPLHYLPTPRPVDPRQHRDDGNDGGRKTNEPYWKRVQREREEREAAEAKSGVTASTVVREAQRTAEELRGNTHSESEQLHRLFVTTSGTSEIDWVQTLAARLNLQKSLNKAQEVRRFIR